MKVINHSVDSGMCGGINLKYILKVYYTDQFWGPSTVHVQWVPGLLSPDLNWLGHETDHSLPANATLCNILHGEDMGSLCFLGFLAE
jgi:hypothetical protein